MLTDAAVAAVDPAKFMLLFNKLGKVEGAASTLRGALFEFIVADLVRKSYNARTVLNKVFRENGKDAVEVDVLAVVENKCVYFIECKGNLPGRYVSDDDVEKWLHKRIPFLHQFARDRHPEWRHLELRFELWTTGELTPEAMAKIVTTQASVRPQLYTIGVRNAEDIRRLALETRDPALREVLDQHFLKHPLADADGDLWGTTPVATKLPATATAAQSVPATSTTSPMLGYEAAK
jgi:hypothetical protein